MTPEAEYMTQRVETIQSHFETAIPVDDFVFRLEMALNAFGFDGDNTICESPPSAVARLMSRMI